MVKNINPLRVLNILPKQDGFKLECRYVYSFIIFLNCFFMCEIFVQIYHILSLLSIIRYLCCYISQRIFYHVAMSYSQYVCKDICITIRSKHLEKQIHDFVCNQWCLFYDLPQYRNSIIQKNILRNKMFLDFVLFYCGVVFQISDKEFFSYFNFLYILKLQTK